MANSNGAGDSASGMRPEHGHSSDEHRSVNPSDADFAGTARPRDAAPTGSAGDSIHLGDITNATGVAVGAGASVTIHAAEQAFDVSGLPNPYLGLQPFTYDKRTRYAGRDQAVRAAVDRLTTPGAARTLLFVTGASGSGKSSFAQAGLVPALETHYGNRTHSVRWAVFRPSHFPLAGLIDALAQLGLPATDLTPEAVVSYPDAVLHTIERTTPARQINVLVIDQVEELFVQSEPTQAQTLVSLLASWPAVGRLRTHLVLTLRSDYLPELFEQKALYDATKHGVELRAMEEDELRDAIMRPLQQYQAEGRVPAEKRFEDALVRRVAHDAGGDAAYLPLLQVALEQLWKAGSLRLSAYERPGKDSYLSAAIRARAEAVYDHADAASAQSRTEADRAEIMHIFLDLVEVSLDDDARRHVRRRRTYAELAHGSPDREQLIKELVDARLLSSTVETQDLDATEMDVVDIIHESLIHNWPRLGEAIEVQRQVLRQRVRFEHALREWLRHDQSDDYLLRDVWLAEAQALARRGDIALRAVEGQALLRRSIDQQNAEQQRALAQAQALAEAERQRAEEQQRRADAERQRAEDQRRSTAALQRRNRLAVALACAAVGVALLAGWFWIDAEARRREAQRQERIAYARQLAAQAGPLITTHPQRSLLLLIEAVNATLQAREPVGPAVEEPLRQALASMGGLGLPSHEGAITAVAISADSHWLVTGSIDTTARVWDLTADDPGSTARVLKGHEGAITAVAISADSHWLVTGGAGDNTAWVWDLTADDPSTTGRVLKGHEGAITAVAISADSHWLVTGSDDRTARVWDLTADDPSTTVRVLRGHKDAINTVAISADNHWLVTGSIDTTARVWDLTADDLGSTVRVLKGHKGFVEAVAISADSHWLVTGSAGDNTAWVWDLTVDDPSTTARVLRGHEILITAVAISADNHWLVTGSIDTTARLWDLTADDPSTTVRVLRGHEGAITAVAVTADSHWLITGSDDHTARLWDLTAENPTTVYELRGHEGIIRAMAISADDHWLVTGSDDRTARLWDLTADDPSTTVRVLRGHEFEIYAVVLSADNHWLITGSGDTTARLWDLTADDPSTTVRVLRGHEGAINSMAISADSHWLVTGGAGDTTARVWDLTADDPGTTVRVLRGHEGAINSMAISADSHWLFTGSDDHTVRVWDLTVDDPSTTVRVLRGHEGIIKAMAISADDHWLVTGSDDRTARVWDLTVDDPGTTVRVLRGHEWGIYAVALSADNHWLVTGSGDTTARLWDLTVDDPSTTVRVLRGHEGGIYTVAISADSHWLVTGGAGDTTARVWDLTVDDPSTTVRVLRGHEGGIYTVAISADSHWLVTGSEDTTARVWDLTADDPGTTVRVLRGHEDAITAVVISADSHWLVTGSRDITARVWNLRPNELADQACRAVGRNLTSIEWQQYLGGEPYRKTCPDLPSGEAELGATATAMR